MTQAWEPEATYSRERVLEIDAAVRALPDIAAVEREDVFRIESLGLAWDIGVVVHEPADPAQARRGPSGRKTGFLLLHGGSGDSKSLARLSRLLAGKFGHRVVAMTFPGRYYLADANRDWPGDTVADDGSVRTPIWLTGEHIGRDEYEVVRDTKQSLRYGTRTLARAKPGTTFWHRMAAWPAAFEDAMIEAARRHFPADEWVFYTHGHSTGGAFSAYITQRIPNCGGQAEIETAPLGYINAAKHDWSGGLGKIGSYERPKTAPAPRTDPFNELSIRTWRDLARYHGPEALGKEGPSALMRLPSLMEEVFEAWARGRQRPNFKAEYIVTHNVLGSLEAAARAAAGRLGLDAAAADALVTRYRGYCSYDERPGARPVPPIFYINSAFSRDNSFEAFDGIVLPMLAALRPAPKVRLAMLGAGTHIYYKPEPDLPLGLCPVAAQLWHDAVTGGFYD